jgi:hypothetical protein
MRAIRTRAGIAVALAAVLAVDFGCTSSLVVRQSPVTEPTTLPRARVFLIGDGGLASFQEADASEQAEGAEQRVEKRHAPPLWARPAAGEKKVFADIVDEAIAGAIRSARPARLLQTLKGEAKSRDRLAAGTTPLIVWLGDNVYEHGVPRDPGAVGYQDGALTPVGIAYVEAAATVVVQAQVAVEAGAHAVFVAGNHDWDHAVKRGPAGRERVIEEGEVLRRYVQAQRAAGALPDNLQIGVLPGGGCPGPATVDLPITPDARVRVAALDTEWLITENPDEGCVSGGRCQPCDPATAEGVYAALAGLSHNTRPGDALLVVGHHPLRSYGLHAAQFFWSRPESWMRWAPLSQQDAPHPRNRRMREGLAAAYDAARGEPLLYAAGHEHSLQLIHLPAGPYVAVSGSASKTDPVRAGGDTVFAHSEHGYMVVDFFEDGRVLLYVVEVPDGDGPVRRHPPFELRAALHAAGRQSSGVEPEQ